MRNYDESLGQLERIINSHHKNVIVSLKNSNVRFSEKEFKYIIYMLSGLSNRSICLLFDIDEAALYRIKYKVKTKMLERGLDSVVGEIFCKR